MQHILFNAIATFLALFPIANPVGAIPIFHSLTEVDTASYRNNQAWHTALNVIWVLALFLVAGRLILDYLHISLGVLRIAGGLLVAHTAWEMINTHKQANLQQQKLAADTEDISFTPMAIPMVSGPGAIGVVISLSTKSTYWLDYVGCLVGILLLGISLYICLAIGDSLMDRLGKHGVAALNRILGFFMLAIGVQFIADGSLTLVQDSLQKLIR